MPMFKVQFKVACVTMGNNIITLLDVNILTMKDIDEALYSVLNDPIYRYSFPIILELQHTKT